MQTWINPKLRASISPIVAVVPVDDNDKAMAQQYTYLVQGGLAFQPHEKLRKENVTIENACSPNLIRTDMIAEEYSRFVTPTPNPNLFGASRQASLFRGTIQIDVTLGDTTTRVWFGVVDYLPQLSFLVQHLSTRWLKRSCHRKVGSKFSTPKLSP